MVMHLWGGLLLALGVHALCRIKSVSLKPSLTFVLVTITIASISWEVFEWATGLYNSIDYVADTIEDIALAFVGGLIAHFILKHLYNKKI